MSFIRLSRLCHRGTALHFILCMPLWLLCLSVRAETDALAADQASVRELMRLESAEAIALAQARATRAKVIRAGAEPVAAQTEAEDLRLAGIYGVGRKLLAEVHVGAIPMVYMRGHPWPVGTKAHGRLYRLRSIDKNCVELERNGETRVLCIKLPGKGG